SSFTHPLAAGSTLLPYTTLFRSGDPEDGDPVDPAVLERLERDPRVHLVGHQPEVRPYYAAMSVLALPSAREGFPQTLLEGSAMRSEEHTSELQSRENLVCRLLLE